MDETTQQNAALVEEAAAASQAIVEQAQALNAVVARYNVGAVEMRAPRSEARVERRSKERPWANRGAAAKAAATAPARAASGGSDWSEF